MDLNLCKEAVTILSKDNNPLEIIIEARKKAGVLEAPNVTVIDKGKFWSDIANKNGWRVQQNIVSKHFRFLSPESKLHGSAMEAKFSRFLSCIIEIGNKRHVSDMESSMPIYQVIVNEKFQKREGCILLKIDAAEREYPNTKDLAQGYYTNHPIDEKALIPIENYFSNIALSQDDECIVLLGKMGAKSVHIRNMDEGHIGDDFSSSADIMGKIHAGIGVSIRSSLKNTNDLYVEFEGNSMNFSPDILKESIWFRNNSNMNAILDARSSNNQLTKYLLKTQLSSSFSFNFDIAAKVLSITEASLRNEYENVKKKIRIFDVAF
jgi:hypothetical protein